MFELLDMAKNKEREPMFVSVDISISDCQSSVPVHCRSLSRRWLCCCCICNRSFARLYAKPASAARASIHDFKGSCSRFNAKNPATTPPRKVIGYKRMSISGSVNLVAVFTGGIIASILCAYEWHPP